MISKKFGLARGTGYLRMIYEIPAKNEFIARLLTPALRRRDKKDSAEQPERLLKKPARKRAL